MNAVALEPKPLDLVAARWAVLKQRGADAFDPPTARFVEALLGRRQGMGVEAQARLAFRIEERLSVLETSFEQKKAEAQAWIEQHSTGQGIDGDLTHAMERGDYKFVLWHGPPRVRRWGRAVGRPRPSPVRPRWAASGTSEARALMAVGRAVDALPEDVGPYNSLGLAVRTLQTMAEVSPPYLSAFIGWLEDVAYLASYEEPPERSTTQGARRGRGGESSSGTKGGSRRPGGKKGRVERPTASPPRSEPPAGETRATEASSEPLSGIRRKGEGARGKVGGRSRSK